MSVNRGPVRGGLIAALLFLLGCVMVGTAPLAAARPVTPVPAPTTYPPSIPPRSSGPQISGTGTSRFCVDNYAPNSDVKVYDNGKLVGVIHTDPNGHGCITVPVTHCSNVSAIGLDSNSDPARSTSTVCVLGEKTVRGSSSSGLPFTGAPLAATVAAGIAVIGLGFGLVVVFRRRRLSGSAGL